MHARFVHDVWLLHAEHALPNVPQNDELVPVSQVVPLQHPVGHEVASQVAGPVQAPKLHVWPTLHATHAAPFRPHSALVGLATQRFP